MSLRFSLVLRLFLTAGLLVFLSGGVSAQFGGDGPVSARLNNNRPPEKQRSPAVPTPVTIADEPRAIDPATLLPPELAAKVTIQFNNTSLADVVTWLRDDRQLNVHLDAVALRDEGLLTSEPVTDELRDEPLYLLLDRLRWMGLDWRYDNRMLVISTKSATVEQMRTLPYNLGEFLDQGYELRQLEGVMSRATGGAWDEVDGIGGAMVLLGDVIFVKHTDQVHREIQGLLRALQQPARRTFTLEPPQHTALRQALQQPVTADFRNVALSEAISQLAEQAQVAIRIDLHSLKNEGVRDRTPVSLQVSAQPLDLTLRLLLDDLGLIWELDDGQLQVLTRNDADDHQQTAVYDVRDLCRDASESSALAHAVYSQTNVDWEERAGAGGELQFPRPGIMVIRHTGKTHDAVLDLLESWRAALKLSKPRPADDSHLNEVITRYYRLPTVMAAALARELPVLVPDDHWQSEGKPDATGTISLLPVNPGLMNTQGLEVVGTDAKGTRPAVVVDHSALVIRQTRRTHRKIGSIIHRLQSGDPFETAAEAGMGSGMMGGMGGFGGGFFSVPAGIEQSDNRLRRD